MGNMITINVPANAKVTRHPILGVYKIRIPRLTSWDIFHAVHKLNKALEPDFGRFLDMFSFKIYGGYVAVPIGIGDVFKFTPAK